MTDNETMKALECCARSAAACQECPHFTVPFPACKEMTAGKAIDLIYRLKAENKKLKEQIGEYPFKCKVGSNSEIHSKSIEDYDSLIGDISAQAIKKFAEKLKEQYAEYDEYDELYVKSIRFDIDCLVKEMGEEDV